MSRGLQHCIRACIQKLKALLSGRSQAHLAGRSFTTHSHSLPVITCSEKSCKKNSYHYQSILRSLSKYLKDHREKQHNMPYQMSDWIFSPKPIASFQHNYGKQCAEVRIIKPFATRCLATKIMSP
ncbi:hypothetical protein XF_1980 [Xylella fastidiosa 9a5c]|uniref:Uncharacterized protein n=1 Tax=Xylella fastidiosa (strain 9a5c) TaxID=160492 RepID=Q9PC05_XYLFA|nr:hypothetical protein XF_1980 [Xylella fastidiosa 9a5c]